MNTTIKDKRAVILEFHSSPDAILNALHQAGWQIIPKKRKPGSNDAIWEEQPQRSEQEWTPDFVREVYKDYGWEGIANDHKAALAAERQRHRDALDEHDNEVRKPLVDALEEILATSGDPNATTGEFDTAPGRARRLLDALAKVKKL